mmetsp:Transcript_25745/g.56787  ORF Transcript_25745/g.56787 Transcript_25745/m.56787 type:complete len:414 (+) Transcript_25745:153-1394(+)
MTTTVRVNSALEEFNRRTTVWPEVDDPDDSRPPWFYALGVLVFLLIMACCCILCTVLSYIHTPKGTPQSRALGSLIESFGAATDLPSKDSGVEPIKQKSEPDNSLQLASLASPKTLELPDMPQEETSEEMSIATSKQTGVDPLSPKLSYTENSRISGRSSLKSSQRKRRLKGEKVESLGELRLKTARLYRGESMRRLLTKVMTGRFFSLPPSVSAHIFSVAVGHCVELSAIARQASVKLVKIVAIGEPTALRNRSVIDAEKGHEPWREDTEVSHPMPPPSPAECSKMTESMAAASFEDLWACAQQGTEGIAISGKSGRLLANVDFALDAGFQHVILDGELGENQNYSWAHSLSQHLARDNAGGLCLLLSTENRSHEVAAFLDKNIYIFSATSQTWRLAHFGGVPFGVRRSLRI